MKDWVAYYDSDHSIYVNARHRDVHYARLADAIVSHVPSRTAAVLDYGCGEALRADRVADAAGRLTLAEAGPTVRSRLIERFKGNPKITVISTGLAASMPPQSFDMVILHSVSQYLTPEEFDQKAALFHRLLQPGGLLVVGDVVPPDATADEGGANEVQRAGDGVQTGGGRLHGDPGAEQPRPSRHQDDVSGP